MNINNQAIDEKEIKEVLSDALKEIANLNVILSDLDVLFGEAKLISASEEERFFSIFGSMLYTAPAPLHSLVRKCHDEKYKIHPKINEGLEKNGLIVDGAIPPKVKKYLIAHFKITKDKGISMSV